MLGGRPREAVGLKEPLGDPGERIVLAVDEGALNRFESRAGEARVDAEEVGRNRSRFVDDSKRIIARDVATYWRARPGSLAT